MRRPAALALAAAALAGCGGGGDDDRDARGKLVWDGKPQRVTVQALPDDRILSGMVKNEGLKPLAVESKDIRVVDADGKPLKSNGVFLRSYLHRLDPPTRERALTDREEQRTGLLAKLEPGKSAPLTVSWREAGGRTGARIEYGQGSLPLE